MAEKWEKAKARFDKGNDKKRKAKAMEKETGNHEGSKEEEEEDSKMTPEEKKKHEDCTSMRV